MVALRVLASVVGVVIVVSTLLTAVRTLVVPRAESVGLTRWVFSVLRKVFDGLAWLRSDPRWVDRVMSLYAPVGLLSLPLVWLTLIFVGFALLFWASGEPLLNAFDVSGSSLLTLGFTKPGSGLGIALAFVGAALVMAIVVLLLVTYLPTLNAAFAEREKQVVMLEARAGAPATGVEFIERMWRIRGLDHLDPVWEAWEEWFAQVQASHTSLPALAFFRSQRPDQSWVTSAGAVLDAAALFVSCVDHRELFRRGNGVEEVPPGPIREPNAELCIRAGYLCLRDIAAYFRVAFDPDPRPDDPVAVTREEFDDAWTRMAAVGVPLRGDPDDAWRAFAGWRVNYETTLLGMANLVVAPEAPWNADRSPVLFRGPADGPRS